GLGQEVRVLGRLAVGHVDQGDVQDRFGRGVGKVERDAQQQHAMHQQREQGGGAEGVGRGGRIGRHVQLFSCALQRGSITSNNCALMFSPYCASSSRAQVGEVTLISVR